MGRLRRLVTPLALGAGLVWAGCEDSTGPDPCVAGAYAVGQTANGSLSSTDCELTRGSFADFYQIEGSTQLSALLTLTSASVDPFLLFYQGSLPDGLLIAQNDDEDGSTNSALHIIAAPGTYVVGATSFSIGETGSYALSSAFVPEAVENCSEVWVTPGIATAQTIETTDCIDVIGGNTFYADAYLLTLFDGETATITMTSTAVDAFLELWDENGDLVASNDDIATGDTDARIVYTASATQFYLIVASTNLSQETGAYALTVN